MAELTVDEFGMNFHPIYFSHSKDGFHLYYITKISYIKEMKFHFLKEWNVKDVFNQWPEYEFHTLNRKFMSVIFWHSKDEWHVIFHNSKGSFSSELIIHTLFHNNGVIFNYSTCICANELLWSMIAHLSWSIICPTTQLHILSDQNQPIL